MKIRNKLIITLLLISIIPILVIGVVEILKSRSILAKQIGISSLELSRSLMRQIDEYLYTKYVSIQGWTRNKCLNGITSGDEYGNIFDFLTGLAKIHDEYYYINCLNTNGEVVASNNVDLIGRDMSTDAGFNEALNGNKTIQDVAFNETIRKYTVVMSVPVMDITKRSEIIGVLTVALKWNKLNEMITRLKVGGKEQTVKNHIMLLNKDGLIISCFDPDNMFTENLAKAGIRSARYAQEHKEGYLIETTEHDLESFSTYTYSREYKDLPHLDWNLVLFQDPKTVFAVIGLLKDTTIFTSLGTVGILIIISFVFARRISRPILLIASTARAIGKGDMETRLPVNTNDEIGLLSTSINKMVDDLKESNSALQESEETLRNIVDLDPDIIYRLDQNGYFTYVSPCAVNVGINPDDLIGKHFSEIIHPDDQELARFRFNERRSDERAVRNLEIRIISPGKENMTCEVNEVPILLHATGLSG